MKSKKRTLAPELPDLSSTAQSGRGIRNTANLSKLAHRALTELILTRELPGGEVIIEGRLAETLDVSRTPLREALVRLAGEGLLVKQASRSFAVRKVSASEFFQSMKVRETLEAEATSTAAGRIPTDELMDIRREVQRLSTARRQGRAHWQTDDRLHMALANASGNAVLAEMIRELRIRTRLFEVARPFDRVRIDAEEHLAIIDAQLSGDAREARRTMLRHLRNLRKDVMEALTGR